VVRWRVVWRGIFGGFSLQCYYKAIQCLPFGDAITLASITPAFTVLFAIPLLGEKLSNIKSAAIFLSVVGAVCIAQPRFLFGAELHGETDSGRSHCEKFGYIAAAFGSLSGALVFIMIRMVGSDGHTIQLIFSWFVFTCLDSFVLLLFTEDWVFPKGKHWVDISFMILCGSVAHYMMNHAGRICPAGVGSILKSTDVMWAYIWEITVFQVIPNFWAIIGAILVFFSGAIIGFSK